MEISIYPFLATPRTNLKRSSWRGQEGSKPLIKPCLQLEIPVLWSTEMAKHCNKESDNTFYFILFYCSQHSAKSQKETCIFHKTTTYWSCAMWKSCIVSFSWITGLSGYISTCRTLYPFIGPAWGGRGAFFPWCKIYTNFVKW